KYTRNGYYHVYLYLEDYEYQKSEALHVVKIDGFAGELNETVGQITIRNKANRATAVNVLVNHYEQYDRTVNGSTTIDTAMSPDLNEVTVTAYGKTASFLFNGTEITVIVDQDGIHLPSDSKGFPGFSWLLCSMALVLVVLLWKRRY
ncbi:MAG: hypothetical protein ACP5FL_06925, partial [Thermoplasmatota archaeon]